MKNLNWMIFAALALVLSACNKAEEPAGEDLLVLEIATATERATVEPEALPRPIQAYVEEVLFDTYLETAFLVSGKGYELNLGSGENLFFDLNSNLLEFRGPEDPRLGPNGPHGPCYRPGSFGNPVALERLPNAVTRYINANYPDNEIGMTRF